MLFLRSASSRTVIGLVLDIFALLLVSTLYVSADQSVHTETVIDNDNPEDHTESQETCSSVNDNCGDNRNENENEERPNVDDAMQKWRQFEFPKLVRLDPGRVGDEKMVALVEGRTHIMITRGVRPPVFEIPDFLTPEECDFVIDKANQLGLSTSHLFGVDVLKQMEEVELSEVSRVSKQAWLQPNHLGEEFLQSLQERVSRLSQLPLDIIIRSEYMQVVNYGPGGHYHAHLDTVDNVELPCCFQTTCRSKEETPGWAECCRICRYMTVLYYLNEVEEGGETAFPLVDMDDELFQEKMTNLAGQEWSNLSKYCHNSSLVVKPKRGTAIMWYNHFVSDEGYLGQADQRSHHGGCNIVKGTKWVANTWISAPSYEHRFKPSLFYTKN